MAGWRGLAPLTRGLAIFAVANVVLMNAALVVLPGVGRADISALAVKRFLLVRAGDDSWGPMSRAWRYLHDTGNGDVYDQVFFRDRTKFQYPLTSLLPIEGMQELRGDGAISYRPLNVASWLAVWGTAILVALILERAVRLHIGASGRAPGANVWLRSATAIGMTISFYPIARSFSLGQAQTWNTFLFTLMLWLWLMRRPMPAGVAAGLMCALKPQMGLLFVWAGLRKQWSFAGALAGTVGVALVASVLLYGIRNNVEYARVLAHISRYGEAYFPNQSVNGLLNRLLHNGSNDVFQNTSFPPFNGWVYAGTMLSSAALVGFALFWRRGEAMFAPTTDLMIAGLTAVIASPVAWEHHYGVLMAIYAVLLPSLIRRPVFGSLTLAYLAASYVLTGTYFQITRRLADTPFTIFQSYLLFGGVMVLFVLYRLRRAEAADARSATGTTSVDATERRTLVSSGSDSAGRI